MGERRRDGGDIKNVCCSFVNIHAEFFLRLRTTTNTHSKDGKMGRDLILRIGAKKGKKVRTMRNRIRPDDVLCELG